MSVSNWRTALGLGLVAVLEKPEGQRSDRSQRSRAFPNLKIVNPVLLLKELEKDL